MEMLTNTIAEIRTYGEGFVIVDQSPSSVDIAAIKNTNTKIVLRIPEANDREAVGRSIGLTEDQVNEIAKLPSGVAVVYQNDWINPVLTMINKANITESAYEYNSTLEIKPLKIARTELVTVLMQPWFQAERISRKILKNDLKAIEMDRFSKKKITDLIDDYVFCGGILSWDENDIHELQKLVKEILGISNGEFERIIMEGSPEELQYWVSNCTAIRFLFGEFVDIWRLFT